MEQMCVAVVGTGYVGTVAAATFAFLGHNVIALEADTSKLEALLAGRAPFFESGVDDLLARVAPTGRLKFTNSAFEAVHPSDVVFLCVGTPSSPNGRADMSAVQAAASEIGSALDRHRVLVTKSTVPIGTARWLESIVEDALPSGVMAADQGFSVVSNPEFLREGSAIEDFLHPDRVVLGGDNPAAIDLVAKVYRPILDQTFPGGNSDALPPLVQTSLATAEMVKHAANAFLATKVSFINEIAAICKLVGADVVEVATALGLDSRINPLFLDAGLGWGGSCFGKDLNCLLATADQYGHHAPLLEGTVAVNRRQRKLIVDKLRRHLKTLQGRRIGLLGLAFKPGTDDVRDSPAVELAARLLEDGAVVIASDPVVRGISALNSLRVVADAYDVADRADAVVLCTEWPEYLDLDLGRLSERMRGELLVDGRNMLSPASAEAAGLIYEGVGRTRTAMRIGSSR